jgi:DNA-binding XRE family transcriptional regulator
MDRKAVKLAMVEQDIPSQRELARRAGVHEVTLCQILTGRLNPTPVEKFKIAHALGRKLEEVFPSEESPG